ncbi:helix-turn-helix transcriptional regulator [Novosphingopyxis sp.]|uniref:helix-turn-helix transcriptional regulator n=1 Tax=Novosphingopyxis sp. TaxID=2709690 RepID=UPI003B59D14F
MPEQNEVTNEGEPRRVARLIRLKEVQHRVGLGRSTIYRWMSEGKFPKPVQIGGYIVAWPEEVIDEWVNRLAEVRRLG